MHLGLIRGFGYIVQKCRHYLLRHPPDLLASLRLFEEAHTKRTVEGLRAAFHDDASVETFASGGRPLGPDQTVEAIRAALEDEFFELGDWRHEPLAPTVALVVTTIRYHVTASHIRHTTVYRLISGKDGLIWRGKLFRAHADAVAHWERHGPSLGMDAPNEQAF